MCILKGSPADPNKIYASQTSAGSDRSFKRSDDGGKTWHQPELLRENRRRPGREARSNKLFTMFSGTGKPLTTHQWYDGSQHPWEFKRVWHLEPSLKDPDTIYGRREDAASSASTDGGENWKELPASRPWHRPKWQAGGACACIRSFSIPAIRSGCGSRSRGGRVSHRRRGKSWKPINRG